MTDSRMAGESELPAVAWTEFLTEYPPGVSVGIKDLAVPRPTRHEYWLNDADVRLHCGSEHCGGVRFFVPQQRMQIHENMDSEFLLTYQCRNCGAWKKMYAVLVCRFQDQSGHAYKVGEVPEFGPPVPSRLVSLLRPDHELFSLGRRCESQGLGIGAFAYYRRVVQRRMEGLIDGIIKVATRTGASADHLERLHLAKTCREFSRAVETIKDATPRELLIEDRNPLTLLHRALSEGLHEGSDAECLKYAHSVRVVLTELAEKMDVALRDRQELKQAVSQLMKPMGSE